MFGGGIGIPELMIILVIVLLVFGPSKLPEIAKGLGRAIRDFRDSVSGLEGVDATSKKDKNGLKDGKRELNEDK